MSWTDRILLAFPVDLFGTSGETLARINELAYIVDPDAGGADTFSEEWVQNGYFTAASQFKTSFAPILGADVATWQSELFACAQAKGAEPLSTDLISILHDGLLYGDAALAAITVADPEGTE